MTEIINRFSRMSIKRFIFAKQFIDMADLSIYLTKITNMQLLSFQVRTKVNG